MDASVSSRSILCYTTAPDEILLQWNWMRGGPSKILVHLCNLHEKRHGKTLDANLAARLLFLPPLLMVMFALPIVPIHHWDDFRCMWKLVNRKKSDTWKPLQLKSSQEPMFADRQSPYSQSMGHNLHWKSGNVMKCMLSPAVICDKFSVLSSVLEKRRCTFAVSKQRAKSARRREELSWTLTASKRKHRLPGAIRELLLHTPWSVKGCHGCLWT